MKVGGANVEDELKLEGKRLNTILHNYKEGYKKPLSLAKRKKKQQNKSSRNITRNIQFFQPMAKKGTKKMRLALMPPSSEGGQ